MKQDGEGVVMGGTEVLPCMLGLNQLHLHLETYTCQLWFMYIMLSQGPLKTSVLWLAEQQSVWPFGELFLFPW